MSRFTARFRFSMIQRANLRAVNHSQTPARRYVFAGEHNTKSNDITLCNVSAVSPLSSLLSGRGYVTTSVMPCASRMQLKRLRCDDGRAT